MRLSIPLVGLIALAACDTGSPVADGACVVGPLVRSSLAACVTGDVEARVAGTLAAGGWGDPGVPYDLWTARTNGSAVSGGVDLYVYLPDGQDIEGGTYAVQAGPAPPEPFDDKSAEAAVGTGVAVVYTPLRGGGVEAWPVVSGEITVEAAEPGGPQRGRFDLVGALDGRQIQIQGRFQRL